MSVDELRAGQAVSRCLASLGRPGLFQLMLGLDDSALALQHRLVLDALAFVVAGEDSLQRVVLRAPPLGSWTMRVSDGGRAGAQDGVSLVASDFAKVQRIFPRQLVRERAR